MTQGRVLTYGMASNWCTLVAPHLRHPLTATPISVATARRVRPFQYIPSATAIAARPRSAPPSLGSPSGNATIGGATNFRAGSMTTTQVSPHVGRRWVLEDASDAGCWDAGLGGREWLYKAWEGTWCDRNWMQGTPAQRGPNDRPHFSAAAPALLGFDEDILGYCSHLVGLDFDGGDLNSELADRCVRANKNVSAS